MIEKALIALFIVSMLAIGTSAAEAEDAMTIIEVATTNGNFSRLVAEVEAAGLAETLNGEVPFTVFAPTDRAFEAVEGLDLIDMTEVLKYHVASGIFMAEDLAARTSIPSLQGGNLTINVTDEGLKVNNANITTKDIVCRNGVIHVIDAVMMPSLVKERLEKELQEEKRFEKELREEELKERLEEERTKELLKNVPASQIPPGPPPGME